MADLLSKTLEEEKQIDLKLTEVTQKAIMPEALAGEEEEGGLGLPSSLQAGPQSRQGSPGLIA